MLRVLLWSSQAQMFSALTEATQLLIRVLCVLNICLHASDAQNSPFGTDLIIDALLMFTNIFHFPLFQELLCYGLLRDSHLTVVPT